MNNSFHYLTFCSGQLNKCVESQVLDICFHDIDFYKDILHKPHMQMFSEVQRFLDKNGPWRHISLAHWGCDKWLPFFRRHFQISLMKIYGFWLRSHWRLDYRCICASLSLNESTVSEQLLDISNSSLLFHLMVNPCSMQDGYISEAS